MTGGTRRASGIDISVVIATRRRPVSLRQAIDSVLAQRGVHLEVLVIDDCVQASARAAVGAIADPRLRYLRNPHPSSGRPAPVRNFGWPLTSVAFTPWPQAL